MRRSSIAAKSRRCRTRRSGAQPLACFTGIVVTGQFRMDSYPSGRGGSAAYFEILFIEDARDVIGDCLVTQRQVRGDLGVGLTVGEQVQQLPLAFAEAGERLPGHGGTGGGEVFDDAVSHARTEDGLAAR